jgi:hypothetical protein
MARHSSIERLPEPLREAIAQLRQAGRTIDEITAHLQAMTEAAPSRSAIGRHVKKMDFVAERMRRSRQVAEALVAELGDAPESRTARLNIELLHSAIMDLFMNAESGEEGDADAEGRAALAGNPQGLMLLAKGVDHLARARRSDADAVRIAEQRAEKKAKEKAVVSIEITARARGLSAETIEAIKAGILGVA